MKAFGTAVTFIGAISLMFAIMVAQRDFQHSWDASAVLQSNAATTEIASAAPVTLAQAYN
jgi:hypothetical protein